MKHTMKDCWLVENFGLLKMDFHPNKNQKIFFMCMSLKNEEISFALLRKLHILCTALHQHDLYLAPP